MNNLCEKCVTKNITPEINITEIANSLSPGFCTSGLNCEKCGLIAIKKNTNNTIELLVINNNNYIWESFKINNNE